MSGVIGLGRRQVVRAAGFICLALLAGVPAHAQGSESYKFLKAVRDHDGNAVLDALAVPGTRIVDARDLDTGETALHIAVKRRDIQYVNFFLQKDADPNLRARDGDTPLLDAATIGFTEGEQVLVDNGAKVDLGNNRGETPLIRAVQNRDLASVRLLIAAGADPDLRDHVAGRSAREYATADSRGSIMLKLIQEAPKRTPKKVAGPQF